MNFSYEGWYRVQSKKQSAFSRLEGVFYTQRDGLLNNERINHALRRHPYFSGKQQINLQPATILERHGMFASQRDILYKKDFFVPKAPSLRMVCDIVDVKKSISLWNARLPYLKEIFDIHTLTQISLFFADLETPVANEYFCHEAGHFIGVDISTKYDQGYFSVQGRTLWPLIYVEEFRADLGGFHFAKELLAPFECAEVILYNFLLRLGVAREGTRKECDAYGEIPYLLFHLLISEGFLKPVVEHGIEKLRFSDLSVESIVSMGEICSNHANHYFTVYERLARKMGSKIAINSLNYYRDRIRDFEVKELYNKHLFGYKATTAKK